MADLRFVGLDDAGTRLLFTLDGENELAAVVDDRLVEATRRAHGWHGRAAAENGDGQAERKVDTTTDELRPREIQARVRAGESPADLAAAAGVDVERIARFARPVLQEREHVALAAQQVVVRTGALDGPLGEVVDDRLASIVPDPDTAWDAWRREDGRWTIALNFRDDVQRRTARWSFDPVTNSVIVDDETARWLTEGTAPPAPTARTAAPTSSSSTPRARRLLSVPDLTPEPALEVVEVVVEESVTVTTAAADLSESSESADGAELADEIADELAALGLQPVTEPAELAEEQTAFDLSLATTSQEAADDTAPAPSEATGVDAPAAEESPAKPAKKRKAAKRASVPSWDDIVFGARKPSE